MLGTVLIVVLILALLGAFPRGGAYNEGWGFAPAGGIGLIVIIILILLLLGKL